MSLAGQVSYNAYSYNDSDLAIFASGLNPTGGYTNSIQKSDTGYSLVNTPPSGGGPEVITMFAICSQFDEGGNMRSIEIEDANGTHQVKVIPITESAAKEGDSVNNG